MSTGHILPVSAEVDASESSDPVAPLETPPAPVAEPSHAERTRTLVAGQSRATLCTIGLRPPGTPFGSVVTFGLEPSGNPCFFVSTMAEHTHNIDADPRASLLVVENTPGGADPLAAGRVTLLGVISEVVEPDERSAARAGYLAANPGAFYVDYGDFRCLRLEVSDVRYVGGFGRMSWVNTCTYSAAEPDPLSGDAEGIIRHMNVDHASALVELCQGAGHRGVVTASMSALDRYGFDVVATFGGEHRETLRIGFRNRQVDSEGVRAELIAMIDQARSIRGM